MDDILEAVQCDQVGALVLLALTAHSRDCTWNGGAMEGHGGTSSGLWSRSRSRSRSCSASVAVRATSCQTERAVQNYNNHEPE